MLYRQEVEKKSSEHGNGKDKKKDEWRKKKRVFRYRKQHPDDQPWILREQKKDGKKFVHNYYICL